MTLASTTSIFELFIQLDSQEHQWFCNEIMNDYCNFIRVSHNTDAERNDCFIDYIEVAGSFCAFSSITQGRNPKTMERQTGDPLVHLDRQGYVAQKVNNK